MPLLGHHIHNRSCDLRGHGATGAVSDKKQSGNVRKYPERRPAPWRGFKALQASRTFFRSSWASPL